MDTRGSSRLLDGHKRLTERVVDRRTERDFGNLQTVGERSDLWVYTGKSPPFGEPQSNIVLVLRNVQDDETSFYS